MRILVWLLALTGLTTVAGATDIDLGDLNVSTDRLPRWYTADAAEANYSDAQSWTQYDATCECTGSSCVVDGGGGASCTPAQGTAAFPQSWGCSPANSANDGGQDWSQVNCMIDKAPDQSVIFLESGTYDGGSGSNTGFEINRSNVVLRCESRETTHLRYTQNNNNRTNCGDFKGFNDSEMCAGAVVSIGANNAASGSEDVAWTAGYKEGATTVTVGDTSGFTMPGWVILSVDDVGHAGEGNQVTKCPTYFPVAPKGVDNVNSTLAFIARIAAINGNQLTLDRGLPFDFDLDGSSCTNEARAYPFRPLESVGVEDCHLTTTSSQSDIVGGLIGFGTTAESWIVGNHLERSEAKMIRLRYVTRNWIQGNIFEDWGLIGGTFNTQGIQFNMGAIGNVVENNVAKDFETAFQGYGGHHNVLAYNYARYGSTAAHGGRERNLFIHGLYSGPMLVEGNDFEGETMIDPWWGSNAPGNTFFKNRNVETVDAEDKWSMFGSNRDGTGRWSSPVVTAREFNMLGNSARYFWSGGGNDDPCKWGGSNDVDLHHEDMWLEKNLYRDPVVCSDGTDAGFHLQSPEPTTRCGSSGNNCQSDFGSNLKGTSAPAAWAADVVPESLYRESPPSWWCEEACAWETEAGIGAWGDDFSAALCKLPAQIMAEGGTCTPVDGSVPPPARPLPPVLLE